MHDQVAKRDDADRPAVLDEHLLDQGVRKQLEVGLVERGLQVAAVRVPPQTPVDEGLGDVQALLPVAVVVLRDLESGPE